MSERLTNTADTAALHAGTVRRNAYFLSVAAGLGCYGCSRYFSFTRNDKDTSSCFHCGLHAMGNVGNLILYDSLGVNWLGWR